MRTDEVNWSLALTELVNAVLAVAEQVHTLNLILGLQAGRDGEVEVPEVPLDLQDRSEFFG
jgi:hypothetical protein